MDSILIVGSADEKLSRLLGRLGYEILHEGRDGVSVDVLNHRVIDLVVIDSREDLDHQDIYQLIRAQANSKRVPVVYLADDEKVAVARQSEGSDKVEVIPADSSLGVIASKIALQLRLRKFDGADNLHASVGEANAALRDINERLMKERIEARSIQQALLPRDIPTHKGFDLAVHYAPLDEVGGDWYHAALEDGKSLSFLVADVTGHGLAAALLGSMAKLAMSAVNEPSPDQRLAAMNRLMTPQLPDGRFVTMGCGVLDADSGTLLYSSAGHPPALVFFRDEQEVHEVKGVGFALGFFEDGEYTLQEVELAAGDIFVAYTDGISEAQNLSGAMYGTARIGDTLKRVPDYATAMDVMTLILEDFHVFLEDRILKDDVTVVVVIHR